MYGIFQDESEDVFENPQAFNITVAERIRTVAPAACHDFNV